MVTSPPPSDNLAGLEVPAPEGSRSRPPCLSSGYGSEVNDAFPTALALDAAAGPNQGSFSRKTSTRVMELIRRSTGSTKPGGNGPVGRENTKLGSVGTADAAADATNKADAQRIAVRPTSPRPSSSSSLRRKLSNMLGLGPRASRASNVVVLDWKPHEQILKVLGYRPRGHGQPFTESYTLSGVLGMGGFGVVREGNINICSTARLGVKQGVRMGWRVARAHRTLPMYRWQARCRLETATVHTIHRHSAT